MWFFDPIYFLFLLPGILLAMWAQWRVQSAYAEASQIPTRSGYSGAEAGAALLQPAVYSGRSLAAVGIAAHESGHALQDASQYPLLVLRNGLVALAGIGSN